MIQYAIRRSVFVALLGVMSLAGACRRPAPATLGAIVQQARQEAVAGKYDKGIALLEGAFQNAAFAQERAPLFGEILRFNLATGRVEAAEARLQEVLKTDPGVAMANFGLIENHLYERQQYDGLAIWAGRLAAGTNLPPGVVAELADWHCKALQAADRPLTVPLAAYLARLPAPLGCKLVREAIGRKSGRDSSAMETLLAVGERAYGDLEQWKAMAAGMRLDERLKHGAAGDAVAFVKLTAPKLTGDDAASMAAYGAGVLLGKGQADAADELCVWAVGQAGARPALRDALAGIWIDAAAKQAAPGPATVTRLLALKTAGMAEERLVLLVGNSVPQVLKADDKQAMRSLLKLAGAFRFGTNDVARQTDADGAVLDLSFCLEEYDTAMRLLERGVSGQDADWHALMRAKVRAHQALKAGRTDEAVAGFHEFMACIEKQEGDKIDPVSRMRYTREMILGFNARRIGDILTNAGRAKEAGDAYLQARSWFEKAAAAMTKDSAESKWIAAETAKIPEKL